MLLNSDYAMVRFDPETGRVSQSTFDLQTDSALPGALDPETPMPGTWISAFDVQDEEIIVARNNVPELSVLRDSTMEVGYTIPLPTSYAGALRVIEHEGSIFLLTGYGAIGKFSPKGEPLDSIEAAASDMVSNGGRILIVEPTGVVRALEDGSKPIFAHGWRPLIGGSADRMVSYDPNTGVVADVDSLGTRIRSVQLPNSENARGSGPPLLTDIVVSPDGALWYSTADDRTLSVVR